jgi:UrcA family protein
MNIPTWKTFGTAAASAAGLAILLLGASAAHATTATSNGVATKVVHYGDLNVNTDEGAQRLYLRLRLAAEDVCGSDHDPFDEMYVYFHCEQDAIARAVDDVALPKLTAVFDRLFPGASDAERVSQISPKTPAIVLVG